MKTCPYCEAEISNNADKCKYCWERINKYSNSSDNPIATIKWKANRDIFNNVTYSLYEDKVVCTSDNYWQHIKQTLPLATLHTISSVTWIDWHKIIMYILLIFFWGIWLILLIIYLCRAKNMITLNDRVYLRYRDKEAWKKFLEAVLEQQKKIIKKSK